MEKLVFVDILSGRDRFYLPILEALGPQRAIFYYRERQTSKEYFLRGGVGSHGYESGNMEEVLARIEALGVEVRADDAQYSKAMKHRYYLTDFAVREHFWADNPFRDQGKSHICYTHSSDDCPAAGVLSANDFFIATTEEMLHKFTGAGKFLCDANGSPEIGRSPEGTEAAIAGLIHISDKNLALGARDKSLLRQELADQLGVSFRPELPLLCYMLTYFADGRAEDKGLTRLGRYANIVIKDTSEVYTGTGADDDEFRSAVSLAAGENIYHTRDGKLNWLMRYAADVNLTNPLGANNLTSILLGLRQISTYTRQFMGVVPPQPVNFTHLLRDPRRIQTKLAYCIAPIPIEATEMLLERIHDQDYWRRYDEQVVGVARAILGRYWVGQEALDRAVGYIVRILNRGTMTPTPQELPGAKVGQGPVTLGFPLDVIL